MNANFINVDPRNTGLVSEAEQARLREEQLEREMKASDDFLAEALRLKEKAAQIASV